MSEPLIYIPIHGAWTGKDRLPVPLTPHEQILTEALRAALEELDETRTTLAHVIYRVVNDRMGRLESGCPQCRHALEVARD